MQKKDHIFRCAGRLTPQVRLYLIALGLCHTRQFPGNLQEENPFKFECSRTRIILADRIKLFRNALRSQWSFSRSLLFPKALLSETSILFVGGYVRLAFLGRPRSALGAFE